MNAGPEDSPQRDWHAIACLAAEIVLPPIKDDPARDANMVSG